MGRCSGARSLRTGRDRETELRGRGWRFPASSAGLKGFPQLDGQHCPGGRPCPLWAASAGVTRHRELELPQNAWSYPARGVWTEGSALWPWGCLRPAISAPSVQEVRTVHQKRSEHPDVRLVSGWLGRLGWKGPGPVLLGTLLVSLAVFVDFSFCSLHHHGHLLHTVRAQDGLEPVQRLR